MKKLFVSVCIAALLPVVALAQSFDVEAPTPDSAVDVAVATLDPARENLHALQVRWAEIKYQMADKDSKLEAIHALENLAQNAVEMYPQRVEFKIWQGIILSTDAGIVKGLSALGKVKQAKKLFEESIAVDPSALEGSALTSLGSLYYQVPGWPLSFGDRTKAEATLKQALAIHPTGIDVNYFYGDLMMKLKRYDEATMHLNRALQAPDRPGRALSDAGRRQEIKAALAQIAQNSQ